MDSWVPFFRNNFAYNCHSYCITNNGEKCTQSTGQMASFIRAVILICLYQICGAFYLPGLVPVNYCPLSSADNNCPVRTTADSVNVRELEDMSLYKLWYT